MVPGTEKVETADDQLRADYTAFLEFEKSDELKHYLELEKEVTSSDFAIRKRQIKKSEYKDSEEYRKENEYKELKKSEAIVGYFKKKKKNPFKEIARWEETFNEPFKGPALNRKTWMTRYLWGEKSLQEGYALGDDMSFPNDDKNVEFYDNKIRLVTKAEHTKGLQWFADTGFADQEFEYTSSVISTGMSFKQKFGIFKAKIKFSNADLSQGFWMVADRAVPHIDVARFEKGKLHCNYFWAPRPGQAPSKSLSKTGGSKYTNDFFIFELEWSPSKLIWRINGKTFKTQSSGVPQDEMFLVFSTNLKQGSSDNGLPAAMEIDWVRVYKLKE
jgi:hypothetical protein